MQMTKHGPYHLEPIVCEKKIERCKRGIGTRVR